MVTHFFLKRSQTTTNGNSKARKNLTFALERPKKCSSEGPHEDKNRNFVLERAQKLAKVDQKRTKSALLSSKAPKMAVLEGKKGQKLQFCPRKGRKTVSVSAITCHQYTESRVCCPAILSSIYLGGDLGMLRSLNREAKRLFC